MPLGRTVAIIQARMTSTRLPGKILLNIGEMPVLHHVIERVRRASLLDEVIVACPESVESKPIVDLCAQLNCPVQQGSETDVLERYFHSSRASHAETIVRITSDCPSIDWKIIDELIYHFRLTRATGKKLDYLSNTLPPRMIPRGMDVEVFSAEALSRAHRLAREPMDREHVTRYFYTNLEEFNVEARTFGVDLSHLRLTLDTQDDYKMFTALVALCRERNIRFQDCGALEWTEFSKLNPEIFQINAHVEQQKT